MIDDDAEWEGAQRVQSRSCSVNPKPVKYPIDGQLTPIGQVRYVKRQDFEAKFLKLPLDLSKHASLIEYQAKYFSQYVSLI